MGIYLANLHPTGVKLIYSLVSQNKTEHGVHTVNHNYTYALMCNFYPSKGGNLPSLNGDLYKSANFSKPIVLNLNTENVTHFAFFSDNYYNFGLSSLIFFTFNTTSNLNVVQGDKIELCVSLLGLGKKVTSSVEVSIRASPLVYITKNMGVPFFYMKNDRTNVTYIVNETNRSLPVEPYTNYTAFFYLNGTKESYTFNTGPPFVDRILNVDPEKPYFGFLYNP